MRIRSTMARLAGLAVGAGVLLLGAPTAMADTGGQPSTSAPAPAPTSTPTTDKRSPSENVPPAPVRSTTTKPGVDETGRAVKPVGAPETGGGMEESSSNTGALVIGGVALVAVAGGGSVAYRRLRKQG